QVIEQPCAGLAAAIELDRGVDALLDQYLAPVLAAHADTLVLACTHYPLVKDRIARRLPAHVRIIDPAPAVARQTLVVAQRAGIALEGNGTTQWWSTAQAVRSHGDRPWQAVELSALSG